MVAHTHIEPGQRRVMTVDARVEDCEIDLDRRDRGRIRIYLRGLHGERAGQIVYPPGKPRQAGIDFGKVAERPGNLAFQVNQSGVVFGKERGVRIDVRTQAIEIGGDRRDGSRVRIRLRDLCVQSGAEPAHLSRQACQVSLKSDDRSVQRRQARLVVRQQRGIVGNGRCVAGDIGAQNGQIDIDPPDIGEQSGPLLLRRVLFGLDTLDPRGEHVHLQIDIAKRQQLTHGRRGRRQRRCHGRNRNSAIFPHSPAPKSSDRRMQKTGFSSLDVALCGFSQITSLDLKRNLWLFCVHPL